MADVDTANAVDTDNLLPAPSLLSKVAGRAYATAYCRPLSLGFATAARGIRRISSSQRADGVAELLDVYADSAKLSANVAMEVGLAYLVRFPFVVLATDEAPLLGARLDKAVEKMLR